MRLGYSFWWCSPRRVIAAAPEIIQRCDENSYTDSGYEVYSHGAGSYVSDDARRKAVSVGASILNATVGNEGTMFSIVNPLQMTYPGKGLANLRGIRC
jgi:hypothetical protein